MSEYSGLLGYSIHGNSAPVWTHLSKKPSTDWDKFCIVDAIGIVNFSSLTFFSLFQELIQVEMGVG